MFEMWNLSDRHSYVIGDFVWTAFDYLGETGIGSSSFDGDVDQIVSIPDGNRPFGWHVSFCGDLDIVGDPKPQSFYRDVLWNISRIEIAVHRPIPQGRKESISGWGFRDELPRWTWPENKNENLTVRAYTRACDRVEFVLNNRSIGVATVDDELTATVSIPYTAGVLVARCGGGDDDDDDDVSAMLQTAGQPDRIILAADRDVLRWDTNDLSFVTATVVDIHGQRVPYADTEIAFDIVRGPARIAALGSGDPTDRSSFHSPRRRAWRGRALAIVQPLKPGTASEEPISTSSEVVLRARALGTTTNVTISLVREYD